MSTVPPAGKTNESVILAMVDAGVFEIDGDGRIWRLRDRRNGHDRPCERRRAEHRTPLGYLQVRVMVNGRRYHVGAHRVVWAYFNGPIPDGAEINHKNGIRDFNHPRNLEPMTSSENVKHAIHVLGATVLRGSRNGSARLTESEVMAIRAAHRTGAKQIVLASRYGVSFQTISKIVRRQRWAHLPDA
jgi:hypothetical protein